jgi:hypothetical protein
VGHLWESSEFAGGSSSFKEKLTDGNAQDRPLDVFRKIAVDIMNQESPAD